MKVRDIMTRNVVRIAEEEPVEVAARTLTHYNIGAMPVCGRNGRVCGMVTDRDLVTRCMAPGRNAGEVKVGDVMTARVISTGPDADLETVARIMGQEQVRRLPVVENGKLCGMVTLGDLAKTGPMQGETAGVLSEITQNVCQK